MNREHAHNGEWILVADDNEDARESIRVALEGRGYSVLEAPNGRDALRQLFEEGAPKVRLIISDIQMPEMSGLELVGVLRRHATSSEVPVIIVSGVLPIERTHPGVRAWIEKPFELNTLMTLVDQHIAPTESRVSMSR